MRLHAPPADQHPQEMGILLLIWPMNNGKNCEIWAQKNEERISKSYDKQVVIQQEALLTLQTGNYYGFAI